MEQERKIKKWHTILMMYCVPFCTFQLLLTSSFPLINNLALFTQIKDEGLQDHPHLLRNGDTAHLRIEL